MPKYGFSLARIFPYNGRIFDSFPKREKTSQKIGILVAYFTQWYQSSTNNWTKLVIKVSSKFWWPPPKGGEGERESEKGGGSMV